ncbi:MAG: GrpB family protein [Planctomycetota bacterium]
MRVDVVPHDPNWISLFELEALGLRDALGEDQVSVHHIGSTAVPGIEAKPIIDILLEVRSLDWLDVNATRVTALGYEGLGECGIPGRRYFRKSNELGIRSHQIHAFELGSSGATRHLAFRDYLRAHPDVAAEYSLLKQQLAASCQHQIELYMAGKDPFIKHHEALALRWASESGRSPVIPS